MRKLFLNIQMFGADLKSANSATYGKRMNETEAHKYYDMTLKDAMYEELTWTKYCDMIMLPKNHGKTITWRTSGKYITNGEPLLEGIVPDEDEPMATYENTVGLQSFGGYITFTDELDLYSIDKGETTRLQRNQGNAVGELFQNKIYDVFMSSKNRWFAGVAESNLTNLSTARDNLTGINLDDLRKIKVFLRRQKVKPFDGGDYVFLVSPEVASDLTTLAKDSTKFTFIELMAEYKNTKPIYEGEIGRWNGFRFVEDNNIKPIATNGDGKFVHGCVILGKYHNEKGVGIVKLEGLGEPKTILHEPGEGGAKVDPINQIGSIGWKAQGWGAVIKYSEAVIVYECLGDDVAENPEVMPKDRDTFSGGYDKNGTYIAGTTGGEKLHEGFIKEEIGQGNILTIRVKGTDSTDNSGIVGRYLVPNSIADFLNDIRKSEQYVHDFSEAYASINDIEFYTNKECTTAVETFSGHTYTTVTIAGDTNYWVKTNDGRFRTRAQQKAKDDSQDAKITALESKK